MSMLHNLSTAAESQINVFLVMYDVRTGAESWIVILMFTLDMAYLASQADNADFRSDQKLLFLEHFTAET